MSSEKIRRGGRPVDPAKREAIVAAACHAFFAHGFAGASIEQIAADAGVSKVTVYSHFGDKRGLFSAAVDAECQRMGDHFTLGHLPHGSLRDKLTAIGEAMVVFLSRPEMVQFERRIAAETEAEPEIGAAFLEAGPYSMIRAFSGFLDAMVAAGEVDISDTKLAAEQFASLCKGLGDLERRFGKPNDLTRNKERIAGAVEVFCRAYGSAGS